MPNLPAAVAAHKALVRRMLEWFPAETEESLGDEADETCPERHGHVDVMRRGARLSGFMTPATLADVHFRIHIVE
jgi:hypothetical protein